MWSAAEFEMIMPGVDDCKLWRGLQTILFFCLFVLFFPLQTSTCTAIELFLPNKARSWVGSLLNAARPKQWKDRSILKFSEVQCSTPGWGKLRKPFPAREPRQGRRRAGLWAQCREGAGFLRSPGSAVPGLRAAGRRASAREALWRGRYVFSRGMVNTSKFAAMFLGLFPALVSLQHFYFRAFSLCIMCFSCLSERVRNLN